MSTLDTTTAGFDAVLKDVYAGPIRDQLNGKTRLLDLFTKGDISQYAWEGRQVIIPLRNGRNTGIKGVAEGGILPTAGHQQYATLKVPMKFIEGRISLTIQVMKAARSDKGSFTRAMDSEQKGLVEDVSRQRNRMLAYFGKGVLAIASAYASPTITVTAPGGVTGTVNVTRQFQTGMTVAVHVGDSDTVRGVDTVASVDPVNGTVTLTTGVAGTVANDVITTGATSGGVNEGSRNLEPMGVLGIVDSTTFVSLFHNIDRSQAANSFFRSTIMSAVGALSTDVLQRGIDNTEEVSGEVLTDFLCHASVRREYLKMLEADRRYSGNVLQNPDGGTKAGGFKANIAYNDIPFRLDKDFAYGTLVGVNKEHLLWLPETEGEWANEDGNVLFRDSTHDNYEARYRVFENFTTTKGNAHVRFDGISATVTQAIYSI